jgi:hypothetical protein
MRLRRGFKAALVAAAALMMTVSARADFISMSTSDEGTRQIVGAAPATLAHGQLSQLTVSVTGSIQSSVDSITEFSIAPIATLPNGAVITSATLFFDVSGAHTAGSPAALSVNGYGDGDGIVGLGDFLKATSLLGSTGNLQEGAPGSLDIPFLVDATALIQSLVNNKTKFVGFHFEGPTGDSSESIWGSAPTNSANLRPHLDITFTTAVPEPSSVLLMGIGMVALSGAALRRGRWSSAPARAVSDANGTS